MNVAEDGEVVWVANNVDGTVDDGWGEPQDDGGGWDAPIGESEGTDDGGVVDGWEGEFNPEEDDPEWPGEYPASAAYGIVFNFRTDNFPEENSWIFSRRSGPGEWEQIDDGRPQLEDVIISYDFVLEADNIYKLEIKDSFSDGTCCLYTQGWFSITNATTTEENANGTVMWTEAGNFAERVEVYIWTDAEGNAQMVEYLPGEGYALIQYELISAERTFVLQTKEDRVEEDRVAPAVKSSVNRHSILNP